MGYYFFDESKHDRGGFTLGACIYFDEDPSDAVAQILIKYGYDPEVDEFKSRIKFSEQPKMIGVRDDLKHLIQERNPKLGLIVVPIHDVEVLGIECLKAFAQFINKNHMDAQGHAYFDQGMFQRNDEPGSIVEHLGLTNFTFDFFADSKIIRGIQIADLCAHAASTMLLGEMGLVNKTVTSRRGKIELDFELFLTLRYNFFHDPSGKPYTGDRILDGTVPVEPYGLYISSLCSESLMNVTRTRFREVFLGCTS